MREPVPATPRKAMTPARRRAALEAYGNRCDDCGASLTTKVEIDHRIQLWMGGPEARENLRPLCIPCHKIKTAADATARAKVKRIHGWAEPKAPSRLRSRGFSTTLRRRFNGTVEPVSAANRSGE